MFAFISPIILIYTVACTILLVTEDAVRPDNPFVLSLVLTVWVGPIGAAWLTAEILAPMLRHRGVLNPAFSWWLPRFVRGLLAGSLGVALAIGIRGWFDSTTYDALLVAGSAAAATALSLLLSRRIRDGACTGCGYDLHGLTDATGGRCPECGAPLPLPCSAPCPASDQEPSLSTIGAARSN